MIMTEEVSALKERCSTAHNVKAMITNKFARVGALVAVGGTSLVMSASAAINFTPIQELLTAVINLIPSFMDLVVAIAPLVVVIAIVSFILKFLDKIIQMLNFG